MKIAASIALLAAVPALALQGGYLGQMGGGGKLKPSSIQKKSFAPTVGVSYLDKIAPGATSSSPSGTGPTGYLDQFAGSSSRSVVAGARAVAAQVQATSEYTMSSNEPVLAAINNLNNNMSKHQRETISVLQDISGSIKQLVDRAESKTASYAAPAPVASTTELTRALEASAAPAGSSSSYLNQMGGGSSVKKSSLKASSWAPAKKW